jgi:aryl-alcohol dehydrogenase-like predicted oxidoreductase
MNEHIRAGRIGAWGGSNWHHQRIEAANAYAAAHGLQGMVASSPNLALAVPQEPMWEDCVTIAGDPEAQAWYRRTQMPVLAWSAQARGFFSGRFSPDGRGDDPAVTRVYAAAENWERLRRAQEAGARHGCSATRVALAWVLHQPLNLSPLVGPATVAELDDTLAVLDLHLSPDEVAWLDLERQTP